MNTEKQKIAFVLGTRPEIIKLSPVIRACIRNRLPYLIIHTGQHYSYELDKIFFKELNLPKPDYNLQVGSAPHGKQTGKMLEGIEKILLKEKPAAVVTLGDPNSAFAGTLSAAKLHIPTYHLEAGRRSFNRDMPEELNRLMIDQISDVLFTPNEYTRQNLRNAGIENERIIVSGDTIVDAVFENAEIAVEKSDILERYHLTPGKYFLATVHRPDNVENQERLSGIISAFQKIVAKYQYPLIFSVHPKTRKMIETFGIEVDGLILTEPLGYLDFLRLEMDACVVLTDSGSLQEEACVLKVPCVTLRDETERQEMVEIGANVLVGADVLRVVEGVGMMIESEREWGEVFGEGKICTESILKILFGIIESG